MHFNYSVSSINLTVIESNAEVNGLPLGLRNRVRLINTRKVFMIGFDNLIPRQV